MLKGRTATAESIMGKRIAWHGASFRRPWLAPAGQELQVATREKPTNYQKLIRHCRPEEHASKTVEEQLDSLLTRHLQRQDHQEQPADSPQQSALDLLRRQMRDELIPVFEDLKVKYADSSIFIEMDAEDFLSGGVELLIEVEFDIYGMQMLGTVTPQGIAFQETRQANNVRGAIQAGPMLRTRHLTGQSFREFLCERITQLVRSAVRSREAHRHSSSPA